MAALLDGSGLRTVGNLLDRATICADGTVDLDGLLKTVPGLTARSRQVLAAACATVRDGESLGIGARVRRRDDGDGGRLGWVTGTKKTPAERDGGTFAQQTTEAFVKWDLLPGQKKQGEGWWRVADLVVVARAGSPEASAAASAPVLERDHQKAVLA